MKRLLGSLYVCALLIALTASAQAVQYHMIDLGIGSAQSINDSGQIVGVSGDHAALWQNGAMQNLGTLGGNSSIAYTINNKGQVAGGSDITGNITEHAFLWQIGSPMLDLGTLPEGSSSCAYGINDNGQVAVNSDYGGSDNNIGAFLWQSGSPIQVLGTLRGINDINNNGQVVGESDGHAFLWQSGVLKDLGTLGGRSSSASNINNNGQVVGYSYTSGNIYFHAFLWQNGSPMQDLGTLGGIYSGASDINDSGQVVGYSYTTSRWDSPTHAFLWQSGSPMQDLGTLGGSRSEAHGINNKGWIVGSSYDSNGVYHAVLWQPIVPEPSSILTLLCGIGTLGGLVLRHRLA